MKNLFKNLSFSKKWIVTVGGMMFLFIIVIAIALANLGGIKRSFQRFMNENYNFTKELKDCQIEVLSISNMIYETAQQPSMLQEFQTNSQKSKNDITNMVNNLKKNYNNTALLQPFESAFNEWFSVLDKFISAMGTSNNTNIKTIIDENTDAMKKIMTTAKQIEEDYDMISETVVTKNVDRATKSIITVDILFAVTLLLCVVMSRVMRRGVLLPLSEVQKAAEEMSKGNLKVKIEYESKDEFGQLASSLKNSMDILSAYVTDIDEAMESLSKGDFTIQPSNHFIGDFENIEKSVAHFIKHMSDTLQKINDVSDEVFYSSDKVSGGSQELARGATEQASAIEELSTSINTVSEQIRNNAENAKMANEKSNIAGKKVEESNNKMKEMITAMSEITEKSTEIEKIIKTINDIAFQTNILALNAAVEAARAGQAGKGFAVVADEVRNLVNKTAEAAKDTTALIAQSIKAVENGSNIVDETANEMNATLETAGEVVQFIDQIAVASNDQAKSIKEITTGMNQISSVIQTNSAASEESAIASGELSKQAGLLKQLTSGFHLLETNESVHFIQDKKITIESEKDFISAKY